MTEREAEAMAELRDLLYDMRRSAEETSYGFFCGGDPNSFTPDPEASTEGERQRHREACEAWPEVKNPAPHGTQVLINEDATDWAERLERCINRLVSDD